jgi:hypothetical protein
VVAANPILIDGKFSPDEWRDASIIPVAPSVALYVQQVRGHVYLGVKGEEAKPFYVDVFLLTGTKSLYNLHASMQVGERLLAGDAWTDTDPPIVWGNHVDWIANEAKPDPRKDQSLPMTQRLYPRQGVEFQLRRSRFPGSEWRIRIEIRDFAGERADIIFPSDSIRMDTSHWMILHLGKR